MNQSESSPWDLIAKIGAVLGFVVLLLNFVGQVLDLVQNSEGTRTALFVVFVLYFMATVWLAFRPSNISQGVRRLSLGVLYVVTIGYAVWVGTWLVPGPDESVVIPADDADGGVKVDLLSKSTYAFNGLQDVSVRNGVGRVFLERNGENDFDYNLIFAQREGISTLLVQREGIATHRFEPI